MAYLCLLAAASAAQGYPTSIVVDQRGKGDYTSIQPAIDNAKAFPDQRITIYIRPGVYKEKVFAVPKLEIVKIIYMKGANHIYHPVTCPFKGRLKNATNHIYHPDKHHI